MFKLCIIIFLDSIGLIQFARRLFKNRPGPLDPVRPPRNYTDVWLRRVKRTPWFKTPVFLQSPSLHTFTCSTCFSNFCHPTQFTESSSRTVGYVKASSCCLPSRECFPLARVDGKMDHRCSRRPGVERHPNLSRVQRHTRQALTGDRFSAKSTRSSHTRCPFCRLGCIFPFIAPRTARIEIAVHQPFTRREYGMPLKTCTRRQDYRKNRLSCIKGKRDAALPSPGESGRWILFAASLAGSSRTKIP